MECLSILHIIHVIHINQSKKKVLTKKTFQNSTASKENNGAMGGKEESVESQFS